jgi:HAD superfamily hydrolase (TIGR01509 family)
MAEDLTALLWDVDGTLAETEVEGHRVAFNRSFAAAGLPWRWDRPTYRRLLEVSGGRERIAAFLQQVEGRTPSRQQLEALHRAKQEHYAALVRRGGIAPRAGVRRLIAAAAAAGLRQVIVTTSGRPAVQELVGGVLGDLAEAFDFWVCGEDVARKKPDPEAYRLALEGLGGPAGGVLVLEDSPAGLAAAHGAGLPCLVCLSGATRLDDPVAFAAAAAVVENLEEPGGAIVVRQGPPCPGRQVTLSWLQRLLPSP